MDLKNLGQSDLISYSQTILAKFNENQIIMKQIANNTAYKAIISDFPSAALDAICDK